jgi:hypothetical protein
MIVLAAKGTPVSQPICRSCPAGFLFDLEVVAQEADSPLDIRSGHASSEGTFDPCDRHETSMIAKDAVDLVVKDLSSAMAAEGRTFLP